MRQRTRRKLELASGLLVVFLPLLAFGYWSNVGQLADEFDKLRREVENEREQAGMEILKWRLMRATEGSLRTGATFSGELMAMNNTQVNLIGFMVPDTKFGDVDEFMLLPLPLECYFCRRPPIRDVMTVQMAAGTTTRLYDGPVLVNGVLRLHEGPNQKSFFSITHAALESAKEGEKLNRRWIDPEHMLPQHTEEVVLDEGIELGGGE